MTIALRVPMTARLLAVALLLGTAWPCAADDTYLTTLDTAATLAEAGRWEAAAEAYRAAAGLDPDDALAYCGQGLCLLAQRKPLAAAPLFRRAAFTRKAPTVAATGLGVCAFALGDLDNAEGFLREALAQDAQLGAAGLYRGLVALCRGQLDDAADWLDRARSAGAPANLLTWLGTLRRVAAAPGEAPGAQLASVRLEPGAGAGLPLPLPLRVTTEGRQVRFSVPVTGTLPAVVAPAAARRGGPAAASGPLTVDSPLPDSVVTGRVPIRVRLAGSRDYTYVSIAVDGRVRAITNHEPLYAPWDTTEAEDGPHSIEVRAVGPHDASVKFGVTVKNSASLIRVDDTPRYDTTTYRVAGRRLAALLIHRQAPETAVAATPSPTPAPVAAPVLTAVADAGLPDQAIERLERTLAGDATRTDVIAPLLKLYRQQGLALDNAHYTEPHTGVRGAQRIALTFDDGPRPGYTEPILELLARYHARGTFLVTGVMSELHPDLVRRIAREGHELGNHTFNHYRLDQLTDTQIVYELVKLKVSLDNIVGGSSRLMRPPGGHYNPRIRNVLASLGYTPVFWNVNCGAYAGKAPATAARAIVDRAGDGGILLLHNGPDNTLGLLPELLEYLQRAGFALVTVSDLLRPPVDGRAEHVHVPGAVVPGLIESYAGQE